MNSKQLKDKADKLHYENAKAIEQLKQIADVKARINRPRIKLERVDGAIVRNNLK